MVRRQVTGLRLEHLPACPADVPPLPGYEYFRVDPHGKPWRRVEETYSLGLSLGRLEGADVRLYVVTAEP